MSVVNTKMLRVSKIPPGTSEDALRFFFENTRKTGGDEIEEIVYDEESNTAVITFEEESVVNRVLSNIPICFQDKMLEIEAHHPEQKTEIKMDCLDVDKTDIHAIKVSGFDPTVVAKDTLKFYFEGRHGANADVVSIKEVNGEDAYILIFADNEAVETILMKDHVISNLKLTVKKYVPPPPVPNYPNKVFISGINSSTSKDSLFNFLEARSKIEPTKMEEGEATGSALVTFKEAIDIKNLQQQCIKKSLEGSYLTVSSVPMTKCILVTGFAETTSAETLEFYFDSKKRSGVEGVVDKKIIKDEGICFIYFDDYNSPITVCERSHTVEDAKLIVRLHYECLGRPADDTEQIELPPPLTVEDVDKWKRKFMKGSGVTQTEFNNHLQSVHAHINWESIRQDSDTLEVKCILSETDKNIRKLIKSWTETAKKAVNEYLSKIVVKKHNTLQEAWSDVIQKIKNLTILETAFMEINDDDKTIVIVGKTSAVNDLSEKVCSIIKDEERILDERKKQVHEVFQTKQFEAYILAGINFHDQLMQDIDGLKVEINIPNSSVELQGKAGSVAKAKIVLLEKLREITSAKYNKLSKRFIDFLTTPAVETLVHQIFLLRHLTATWAIKADNEIIIYALSDRELGFALNVFKDCVTEITMDIDKLQEPILKTKAWSTLVQSIEQESQQTIVRLQIIDQNRITVYVASAADINIGNIREQIQDFLYMNTITHKQINVPYNVKRLLKEQLSKEIDDISAQLKDYHVNVSFIENGLCVKGNKDGISRASMAITNLIQTIAIKTHTLNKAGIVQHINSEDGKTKVSQVERNNRVVFAIGEDVDSAAFVPGIMSSKAKIKETAKCCTATGETIITVVGDITEMNVDVIVNAANYTLDHSGGLARVIAQKGGQTIQQECTNYLRNKTGEKHLSPGEVYCSTAGQLNCKMIAHAVGPAYQDGRHNEEGLLSECIKNCLKEAVHKKYMTIAIPALCSGNFGYPTPDACRVIVEAIKMFLKKMRSTSVKIIYLCDIQEKTVEHFVVSLQQNFGPQSVTLAGHTPKHFGAEAFKEVKHNKKALQISNTPTGVNTYAEPKSHIKISIVKGKIANQEVDVIVNSTSNDLKLKNGAASMSLLQVGGQSLQAECDSKYPNGIANGELAITAGFKLECRNVYHGSLSSWNPATSPQEVEKFMTKCLSAATDSRFTCIAFPALGTGKLGFPKEEVAKLMFEIVETFGNRRKDTTIVDVRFVIFETDSEVLKAFEHEKERTAKKAISQQRHRQTPVFYTGNDRNLVDGNQQIIVEDFDNANLRIYKGDLCTTDAEIIVNCTDKKFMSKQGTFSEMIKQNGGDDLKKQMMTQQGTMAKDKIAVTTAGDKFACDFIVHLDVLDSSTDLKTKLKMVLDKVTELDVKSIALAADEFNYPIDKVAEALNDVLHELKGGASPLNVHVVMMNRDIIPIFQDALGNCNASDQKSLLKRFTGWISGDKAEPKKKRTFHVSEVRLSSQLVFTVFAKSSQDASAAIKAFELSLDNAFTQKTITDDIVKGMSKEQIQELKDISGSHAVEVAISKKIGRIEITGIRENITNAIDEIHRILRHAEKTKDLEEQAKAFSEIVQWSYINVDTDGNQVVDYPHEINRRLEMSLLRNNASEEFFSSDGNKYIIDFNTFKEYKADDPSDSVDVVRKVKVAGSSRAEMPPTWEKMDDKENIKITALQKGSMEYVQVENEFMKSVGLGIVNQIIRIEKIQNRPLYQQYMAKKISMESSNTMIHQNERTLWHGTAYEAVDSINTYGFNRSFCGKNATVWGNGVYFARDASYSARDTYSPNDQQGQRRIYKCKVLIGEFTKGQKDLKVPPAKVLGSHILFDSVVDDPANPQIFVIFQDAQAYPEYLIIFK